MTRLGLPYLNKRTGNMPLRPVLRPDADAILVLGDTDAVVQLHDTGTKVLPALGNLLVRIPDIFGLVFLGGRVPRAPAEAPVARPPGDRVFEQVMEGLLRCVESLEEGRVSEAPVTVDGTAPWPLRAGDGD